MRYRAFLSYSHRDKPVATWLHRKLERYHLPKKLVDRPTPFGPVPRRLTPIFRDREELSASGDLGGKIGAALADSMFLLVICSPAAAASRWVDQEIVRFKALHGEDSVLALIASGEPFASDKPGMAAQECFPRSLRYRVINGALSDEPAEPIAADLRPQGDGRRLALYKLIAGLSGIGLDDLLQRETQRRVRRLAILASASMAGMVAMGGLAFYANARRVEANQQRLIAERESATARATSDFLVGTFALANPETDNPRTITALTILAQGAKRARTDLATQPAVQSRLMATLGAAYNNLGLFDETRDTIERSWKAIGASGSDGSSAQLELAYSYAQLGNLNRARALVQSARSALGPNEALNPDLRAKAAVIVGGIALAAGDTQGGITAFGNALRYYRTVPDINPVKIATVLQNLGLLLLDDQQFAAADRALKQALAINRRALGNRHLSTGQTYYALAKNALPSGRIIDAARYIDQALLIESAVLDPGNRILGDTLMLQGQIRQAQHRLPEAQRALEQAIAIYRHAFGKPHFIIGIAEVYLALVQSDRGQTAAALRTLDDAKHNYDVSYGHLHPNHGDLLVNRATVLAHAGRMAQAKKDCAQGLDILGRTLGKDANYTKAMTRTCAGLAPPSH